MEEMLPLPDGLEVDAHLVELESMGYTIVHGAIPPKLLARLQKCHAQAVKRIKECKLAADWSWESDNPGVVDYFRAYALDPAYEELLTLPSVMPIVRRAIIEGRGAPAIPSGPKLVHEMVQHAPGRTAGGQMWHRDGNYKAGGQPPALRCTFTLNDLAPNGGGTIALAGSHLAGPADNYGKILNSTAEHEYEAPREGRSSSPYDRSANQPYRMPNAVTQSGKAGSCMLNWTSIWQ
jgi:hypothetical protein